MEAFEKLETGVTAALRVLECPVCLEVVTPPLKQCSNGHVTCKKCIRNPTSCSLCRAVFLPQSPVCLNSLLEVLPRFCRYKDAGCKEVFVLGSGHEDLCGFRPTRCRSPGCGEMIKLFEAYAHYKYIHVCYKLPDADSDEFNIDVDDASEDFTALTDILIDERLFYISFYNSTEEDHVKILFEEFPTSYQNVKYSLRIGLKDQHGNALQKTINALPLLGESDEETGLLTFLETDDAENFCMKVPKYFWPHFLTKTYARFTLKFKYTIKRTP